MVTKSKNVSKREGNKKKITFWNSPPGDSHLEYHGQPAMGSWWDTQGTQILLSDAEEDPVDSSILCL